MTRRTLRSIPLVAALVLAGTLPACGDPATLAATFIFITNTWEDAADPNHTFGLNSQNDGQTSGQFTGTEFVSANDNVGNPLTGSWAHGQINFTVQRSGGSVRYSGIMPTDGLNELTFTSPEGGLTIRRQ